MEDKLFDLMERRNVCVERMNEVTELILAVPDDEEPSEEKQAEISKWEKEIGDLEKKIDGLNKKIKLAERAQALKAKNAQPYLPAKDLEGNQRIEVETEKLTPARVTSQIIRMLCLSGGHRRDAIDQAKDIFGEEHPTTKALAASTGSAGGFLVPAEYSTSIIELLRARAVVRRAGAMTMPISGVTYLPRLNSGGTASYVGENENIAKTQQAFGQIKLSPKKLAAVVPISNDLLRVASPSVDDIVVNDLVAGMGNTEDAAFLREDGTGDAPKGMYYWMNSSNIQATAGTALANIETDLKFCLSSLLNNNVRMIRPAWFMSPSRRIHLEFLRDTNGNIAFPEVAQGKLKGFPIFETNNIPTNLGSGTASELYFADMADAVIGEQAGIEIMVSDTAAYHDGTSVVSAFSKDQTVVRVIMKHDFALRHDRSAACITGVLWGA